MSRELPLLLKPDLAQKVHDGLKTQTRRPMNPQPSNHYWEALPEYQHRHALVDTSKGLCARFSHYYSGQEDDVQWVKSPFGQPGDVLYVKEMWAYGSEYTKSKYIYKGAFGGDIGKWDCGPWRSSIHMKKEATRTWLKVKRVWVEWVRDICLDDIWAEGITKSKSHPGLALSGYDRQGEPQACMPVHAWMNLWDSICAGRGLDSVDINPWVWACEFERVDRGGRE